MLDGKGLSTTVADLRFAKPLDEELIRRLLDHPRSRGDGRGSRRSAASAPMSSPWPATQGLIDAGLKLRTMRLPDRFQDQDKPEKQYAEAGLDADGIVETVLKALRHNSAGVVEGARA